MLSLRTLIMVALAAASGCSGAGGDDAECATWCGERAPREANDGWCPVAGGAAGAASCVDE